MQRTTCTPISAYFAFDKFRGKEARLQRVRLNGIFFYFLKTPFQFVFVKSKFRNLEERNSSCYVFKLFYFVFIVLKFIQVQEEWKQDLKLKP